MKQKLTDSQLVSLYLQHKLDAKDRYALERRALDDPFLSDALEGYEASGENPVNASHYFAAEIDKQKHADSKVSESDWDLLQLRSSLAATPVKIDPSSIQHVDFPEMDDQAKMSEIGAIQQHSGGEKRLSSKVIFFSRKLSRRLAALLALFTLTAASLVFILSEHKKASPAAVLSAAHSPAPAVALAPGAQKPNAVPPVYNYKKEKASRAKEYVQGLRGAGKHVAASEPVRPDTNLMLANRPAAPALDKIAESQSQTSGPLERSMKKKASDTVLNEVLVIAPTAMSRASQLQRKAAGLTVSANSYEAGNAVPVGGWPAFEAYLSRQAHLAGGKTGTVDLSFLPDSLGMPKQIKIEHSLGRLADRRAREILESGPAWEFKNPVLQQRIRLAIVFR